jgi:RNA polymerase sigma-54 factor
MPLELKQSVRLSQSLVVTPQLQQAIRLLQLSRAELSDVIQKELLENPVLEDSEVNPEEQTTENQTASEKHEKARDEEHNHDHSMDEVAAPDGTLKEPKDFDWENYLGNYNAPGLPSIREGGGDDAPTYENFLKQSESLSDHLLWQLHLSNMNESEQEIGTEIIGNINEDGYLQAKVEGIASRTNKSEDEVNAVLTRIQEFDPTGVGAADLQECLIIQAKQHGDDAKLAIMILRDHLSELERHNYQFIAKKLSVSIDEVRIAAHLIAELDPKPGRPFNQETPHYITPDVYVSKVGDEYIISLNEDGLPKLRVSDFYRRALMRGSSVASKTKEYIQDRMRAAVWLIKSIHQRQRTLHRVSTSIVKFQQDFFDKGIAHLKPLVLRDVADDIEMHESTISRVTTNKYMHTPRGIFELKFFFNSGIERLEGGGVASEAVKLMVKTIIGEEDQKKPRSDQEIADMLKDKNINIARRTVAKYREALGISSSSRRRRMD